jgi:hypothetical protein
MRVLKGQSGQSTLVLVPKGNLGNLGDLIEEFDLDPESIKVELPDE